MATFSHQVRKAWTTTAHGFSSACSAITSTIKVEVDTYLEHQELIGNHPDDIDRHLLDGTPDLVIAQTRARRAARPTAITQLLATVVFAASAVLTAPVAVGRLQPWQRLEDLLGYPITSSDPIGSWLIEHVAHTPVLAWLLWATAYATWFGTVRSVAANARHGYTGPSARIGLVAATLLGCVASAIGAADLAGPPAAFLAAGAIGVTWHAFTTTARTEAHAVAALNRHAAFLLKRERRAATTRPAPVSAASNPAGLGTVPPA